MNFLRNELLKFSDDISRIAKETFETYQEAAPTVLSLFYDKKAGDFSIASLGGLEEYFVSSEAKEDAAKIIQRFNQNVKPIATAFISESWMSVLSLEEEPTVSPSKDPNRKEILMIIFETFDTECVKMWEIVRNNGEVSLEDLDINSKGWVPKGATKGIFSDMLKENYDETAKKLAELNLN